MGLDGVLAAVDRRAEACDVPGEAAGRGLVWDVADREDRHWWPQGVAVLRGGEVLLVAWYRRGRGPVAAGSRLSVVDRRDPERPRYRHVALVTPHRLGPPTPVRVHAGGIAVVGDVLLLADTLGGIRLLRLSDAVRTPRGDVLPEHARWRAPLLRPGTPLRFSFLSAAAGRLVVGEYRRQGAAPRLVELPLTPDGAPVLDRGRWRAAAVHERQPARMQGVAVHDGTWWLTASTGEGRPGDLHVGRPGAFHRHRGVLPPGPEDVDWAVPGEQLWSATEWPGHRWVFPIDTRRWGDRAQPEPGPGGEGSGPAGG